VIRIVTPDFDQYCKECLNQILSRNRLKTEFIKFSYVDQMVRTQSVGESSAWKQFSEINADLQSFMNYWVGTPLNVRQSSRTAKTLFESLYDKLREILQTPQVIKRNVTWKYCKVLRLYPEWFRNQHIIFSRPGQRHLYLYNFYSLKSLLEKVRFADVIRTSAETTTSLRSDPRSLGLDGNPSGGRVNVFIEARKQT
jgi:hypothetical protein